MKMKYQSTMNRLNRLALMLKLKKIKVQILFVYLEEYFNSLQAFFMNVGFTRREGEKHAKIHENTYPSSQNWKNWEKKSVKFYKF